MVVPSWLDSERCTLLVHERYGIDRPGRTVIAICVHLEMAVWAVGVPAHADVADRLAGRYALPDDDEWLRHHVAVAGDDVAGVLDLYPPATARDRE